MPGRAAIADDAITVTTATRSEAEVREGLGLEAPKVETLAAAGAAGADADAKKAEALVEQEADSDKPDAALSEAGRTLRGNRSDARKAKIQDEINALTRKREEERTAYEREKAERERDKTPPAERKPADAAKPIADGTSAAPEFKFPTWEQWQVDHPDAEWTEYTDARTDARYAFNREAERVVQDRERTVLATKAAFDKAAEHQEKFRADHPDYDEKLAAIDLKAYGLEYSAAGEIVKAPWQYAGIQALLMDSGEDGPALLYHLASHPDDFRRLMTVAGPEQLLRSWGAIEYAAKASATATPKPEPAAAAVVEPAAPPAKPRTSAPAPLTAVAGSSSVTKSVQQLSDDAGEDADAYIAVRDPRLLKRR